MTLTRARGHWMAFAAAGIALGLAACSGRGSGGGGADPAPPGPPASENPPPTPPTPPTSSAPMPLPPERSGEAPTPAPGQFVLFQAGGLYAYHLDSDLVTRLTLPLQTASVGLYHLALSPDGLSVAYVASEDGKPPAIYLAATDGSTTVRSSADFSAEADVEEVGWSPDSTKVAYRKNVGDAINGIFEIHVVDRDGTNDRKISPDYADPAGTEIAVKSAWSPDSRYLAYLLEKKVGEGDFAEWLPYTLEIVEVANPAATRVHVGTRVPPNNGLGPPVWAPDGSRVAYLAWGGDITALYTVRPDGSGLERVNSPMAQDESLGAFYWSPDGTRLAYFVRSRDGSHDALHIAAPDGSSAACEIGGENLGPAGLYAVSVWAPNGSRVMYSASSNRQLYTTRTDCSEIVEVSATADDDGFGVVRWSPDGSHLAYEVRHAPNWDSDLYIAAADGSGEIELNAYLTPDERDYEKGQSYPDSPRLAWSSDGAWLAYAAVLEPPAAGIFAARPDLSESFELNGPLSGDPLTLRFAQFAWSKDGSRLAYEADEDGDGVTDVYVVAPNGAAYKNITKVVTDESGSVFRFVWSP